MTNIVQLREVESGDLPIFFEHQLDPEATRMAAFPSRDWAAFTTHWQNKILSDSTVVVRTISYNGHVAGNILCWDQSGEWEVGYWIGKEYWGRGIATRALAEFLLQVKERPLFAHVAQHNFGSLRVLEKCGFVVERYEKDVAIAGSEETDAVILKLDRRNI